MHIGENITSLAYKCTADVCNSTDERMPSGTKRAIQFDI